MCCSLTENIISEWTKHASNHLAKGRKSIKSDHAPVSLRCAHDGRGATLNELRCSGYWITSCNAAVRSLIFKRVKCCRLRGRLGEQKMADLSMHRLAEARPFTYSEVDMFGPFVIKQRRNEIKCYGAMFTCMASWAVHIEIIHSLNSVSFLQALRQVIACRGNVRVLYSDNGTNFVGWANELKKAYKEMDNEMIQSFTQSLGGDLDGLETHQLQATWVAFGRGKLDLPMRYCHPFFQHIENHLTKNLCWHK